MFNFGYDELDYSFVYIYLCKLGALSDSYYITLFVLVCFSCYFFSDVMFSSVQLAHLVEMEVKHRCNQVLELGFPLGGLAKLFAQDWEGDVTIVMPATINQVNPNFREKKIKLYF